MKLLLVQQKQHSVNWIEWHEDCLEDTGNRVHDADKLWVISNGHENILQIERGAHLECQE